MAAAQKALVLSGGGGRGAYHVGAIEALVEQGWMEDGKGPDIIAGTSIGAINAAALASGMTVAQLKTAWLNMHTEDVHRLSDDMPPVVRPFLRFLLSSVLTSQAHSGGQHQPLSDEEQAMSTGSFLTRMGTLFRSRGFRSLLDTTPWRQTLHGWMDFARINGPAAPALLLTATDLETGALQVFCNRDIDDRPRDVITLDHLMASSSIPAVYPWTEIDQAKYWDGALLANTPLGPIITLAGNADVDIKVVLMTPWHSDPTTAAPAHTGHLPQDLIQALSLTLDWTLLASYRAEMHLLSLYNRLQEAAGKLERAAALTGDNSLRLPLHESRHVAMPTVIAPEKPMPIEWIIDYEEANHRTLFAMGKADAERVLNG